MNLYILGAGFSKTLGLPLGTELWTELRASMDARSANRAPASKAELYVNAISSALSTGERAAKRSKMDIFNAWAGIRQWVRSSEAGSLRDIFDDEPDIELLVTKLLAASHGLDPDAVTSDFEPSDLDWNTDRSTDWWQQCNWVIQVVTTSLNLFFLGRTSAAVESDAKRHVAKWIEQHLDDGDVLLTTNYDVALERFLWESKRWNPNDGYAMPFEVVDEAPIDILRSSQLNNPSAVLVLKLHGSAGWYINTDRNVPFIGQDALAGMCIGRDRGGFPNEFKYEDSLLLEPGYAKKLAIPSLSSVWARARQMIERADALCIIGYSFPPPDRAIRDLVKATPRATRVIVVDPSRDVSRRIELFLGREIFAAHTTFSDWVENGYYGFT